METTNPNTGRLADPVQHYVDLERELASEDPVTWYQRLFDQAQGEGTRTTR